MDPSASSQSVIDLLKITRGYHPNKSKLTVLQERHQFPIMNRWMSDDQRRVAGGSQIEETVMIDENGTAKMVEPYQIEEMSVPDVMAKLQIPWRICQADYNLEKSEILRNKGKMVQLVRLLDSRRAGADLSIANKLESQGFQYPATSSDTLNAWGIPYWLVPITSAQVSAGLSGHIGTNPSGWTDTAGIDASSSTYAMWRSYADVWDNDTITITADDVTKMVRMHRHLKFQTPRNARDWESEYYGRFQGYLSEARLEAMEKKAQANNDRLGADLAKFAGQTVVMGTPLNWNEDVDDISTDPLILVNHNHWHVFCLEGDILAETDCEPSRAQHRVFTTFVDLSFNFATLNRRQAGGRIDYVT